MLADITQGKKPILVVEELQVQFNVGGGWFGGARKLRAVDGVSLAIRPGEVIALVGESGCGKTTVARSIVGLSPISSGRIAFKDRDLSSMNKTKWLAYRREVQIIFQDPFESLNPRKTIFEILSQPLAVHHIVPRKEYRNEVRRLLELVGLSPGEMYLERFPHQFSGGQRQRIGIARALAVRPSVIIADEAVSALDISIRAQILALLRELQRNLNLSYLFITHDLGVVRSLCDRVVVMYLGRVVEEGLTEVVFNKPRHPYTRALLGSSPIPDPTVRNRRPFLLTGDVPSAMNLPGGCRFHPRCPLAESRCGIDEPGEWSDGHLHRAACHFANTLKL